MERVVEEKKLKLIANSLRKSVVEMLCEARSGHAGGPLGMAEVFTALYFNVLHIDAKQPNSPDRDIIVLSNGHICPIQYAVMAKKGFFPEKELLTLRKLGSRLQGHPHLHSLPGIENSGGPLGQGMSQAVGMALAFKLDKKKNRIFCICSDGELNEGQAWEAIMLAAKHNLEIIFIIDRNNIQISGFGNEVMPLEPLKEKLRAFNLHALEVKAHDFQDIFRAIDQALKTKGKPSALIMKTVPGKGVSFMENKWEWHGKAPNKEEARKALKELDEEKKKIELEDNGRVFNIQL